MKYGMCGYRGLFILHNALQVSGHFLHRAASIVNRNLLLHALHTCLPYFQI